MYRLIAVKNVRQTILASDDLGKILLARILWLDHFHIETIVMDVDGFIVPAATIKSFLLSTLKEATL